MADLLRKSAAWLGLVPDERYATYAAVEDQHTEQRDRREFEHSASVTPLPTRHAVAPEPEEEPSVADLRKIVTVCPRTYNEAKTIGEHYRDGTPVIMNLSDLESADAKRLVDFATGLVFGRHGTLERVTSRVFLLSPSGVMVAAEDKERIAGGFFNQS